ncbi:MAG: hypothetical protein EBS29_14600 [Chloroflexia bacterium]|nr:hypothetical protein [Chloroflexia bacterium]
MRALYRVLLVSMVLMVSGCAWFTPPLKRAVVGCNLQQNQQVKVLDDGHALSITLGGDVGGVLGKLADLLGADLSSTLGQQSTSTGSVTATDLKCVFDAISMPDSTRMAIAKASALDGRQSDSFDGYTVTWAADVAGGLDIMIVKR